MSDTPNTPPERIYSMKWVADGRTFWSTTTAPLANEQTWSTERIYDSDTEYVRADLYTALEQSHKETVLHLDDKRARNAELEAERLTIKSEYERMREQREEIRENGKRHLVRIAELEKELGDLRVVGAEFDDTHGTEFPR